MRQPDAQLEPTEAIWTGGLPFQVRFDYRYDGVMRSFEDSLQRLGLPRIDLLVIHDLDIQYHQTYKRIEALLIVP